MTTIRTPGAGLVPGNRHSHSAIATVTYLYPFQGSARYEDDRSDWRLGRRRR
jgi:hypothetical protein